MESFLLVVTGHLPKRSAACQVIPRLQPNELLTVGWNHSSKLFLWKWIILPFYWFSEILPPPVTRLYIKWKLMNCALDSRNSYISSISFGDFPWLHIDSNVFQFRPWLLQSWVDVLDPTETANRTCVGWPSSWFFIKWPTKESCWCSGEHLLL